MQLVPTTDGLEAGPATDTLLLGEGAGAALAELRAVPLTSRVSAAIPVIIDAIRFMLLHSSVTALRAPSWVQCNSLANSAQWTAACCHFAAISLLPAVKVAVV